MDLSKETLKILIHWIFALFLICMISIGIYMTKTTYDLPTYQLHKSLGVIFFGIMFIRIYSTVKYPWQSSAIGTNHEKVVNITHFGLLVLMVLMPVSGLISNGFSGFSGFSVHLFNIIIVPENINELGKVVPFNATVYESAKSLHWMSGYTLATLIILHVLAAFKHHYINKDTVLKRMLFR